MKSEYKLIDPARLDPTAVKAHVSEYESRIGGTLNFDKVPAGSTIVIDGSITDCKITAPREVLMVLAPTSVIQNCDLKVYDLLVEGILESMNLVVENDIELTSSATTIGECQRGGNLYSSAVADKDSMSFSRLKIGPTQSETTRAFTVTSD
ncbi:MAG: hypothetical protein QM533_11610 [Cytophagales bacterium]|nr:hypothetical protein [Cytophagales bacterium]